MDLNQAWDVNSARTALIRSRAAVPWAGSVAVVLWSVGWFVIQAAHGGGSWQFFATGASVLSDLDDGTRAGLHVYAEHPVLQIGPLALGAAWALGKLSDGHGLVAAQVAGACLGVAVVVLVRRITYQVQALRGGVQRPGQDATFLAASACLAPVWLYAAVGSAHPDDVLALAFGVVALALVLSRRPVWAGLAVALAVDSKPWAAVRRDAARPPVGTCTDARSGYCGSWRGRGVASVLHCRPADRPRDPLLDRQQAAVRSAPDGRGVRPHPTVGPTAPDSAGRGPRSCRTVAGPCDRRAPGGDGQPPRTRPEHQSLLHRGPRRWSSALGPDGVTSALAVVEPDRARRPARRPVGAGPRPCARARTHCLRRCCSRVRGVEGGRR